MENLEDIFNLKRVHHISQFVENEINSLSCIKDFKNKDKQLSSLSENFENSLNPLQKDQFDEIIRLTYQLEEYYFTLAYNLGSKYGNI